ncbi:sulfurtransferase TusA family protein [Nitrosococcus oceani]|uniref:SirA-like protein n=2 Tax=Nitrosococcus oceani TaxID=1229 RepID=Q3J7U0_NITOC|nr:sulfurtransferase TusA family protein [Nitrosococcus oceani]ABA59106.1 SirA-like protein [Nitrosococcus oceani ATCC 19707]KFI18428.1 recombinase [Nitrosococcus oceani C-27]KFI21664.1 recombinase [Nitrosococcus oceani]GEM20364.1 recombinase [Nitrosococcus oceani]
MNVRRLDVRHLLCPLPVIRTQQKVKELMSGDVLEVVSTDPGALNDIPAWCRVNGHRVLKVTEQDREVVVRLEVSKTSQ